MLIARGAENSAGIGGNANYASCGTVTVHGGSVDARGGTGSAGVGGARDYLGNGGNFTIYHGSVYALAGGAVAGVAAIGTGGGFSSCGNTKIYGGTVTAESYTGPAIGGSGIVGSILIAGGVVNASYLSSSSRESAVIGGHLSYKPPVTITGGTSATIYSPNAPCTRAQMAAFIYRNEQANGNGFTGAWMFRIPFADAPEWAYESIAWCYKEGITSGTSSTTFSPDDPCTRAQMVTFLYRCFGE